MSVSVVSLLLELVRRLRECRLEDLFMKMVENGKQNILFKSTNTTFGFEEIILLFH